MLAAHYRATARSCDVRVSISTCFVTLALLSLTYPCSHGNAGLLLPPIPRLHTNFPLLGPRMRTLGIRGSGVYLPVLQADSFCVCMYGTQRQGEKVHMGHTSESGGRTRGVGPDAKTVM